MYNKNHCNSTSIHVIFTMRNKVKICSLVLCFILFFQLSVHSSESPYALSTKKDLGLAGLSLASGLSAWIAYSHLSPLTPNDIDRLDKSTINPIDRYAVSMSSERAGQWSDILGSACLLSPLLTLTQPKAQKNNLQLALIYAETITLTGTIVYLTKCTVKRPRPFVFNPSAPQELKLNKSARMSFFSGHTALSFASAVFFSTTYSDYSSDNQWDAVIWSSAITTASLVGYFRIRAGKHYVSDVIAGALVGSAIGYGIPALHRTSDSEKLSSDLALPLFRISFQF